jgi:L-ascorbate metabolism protein UlaG (beta-lactamase superfamily)
MTPAEAAKAHGVLAPERSIAIHWGTFQLADDGKDEPVNDLRQALSQDPSLPPFDALENGSAIEVE